MEKRLKILFISPSHLWPMAKGTGMPAMYLPVKGFRDGGHIVHLFLPHSKDTFVLKDYEGMFLHWFRIPFDMDVEIGSRKVSDNFIVRVWIKICANLTWVFLLISGTIKGLKLVSNTKFDIIYAFKNTGPIAFILGKIYNIPFIYRVFGLIHPQRISMGRVREYLRFTLQPDFYIITNDGTGGDTVARRYGISDSKIKFWRNGVDLGLIERFPWKNLRQELKIDPGKKVILSVSRLVRLKGVDRLIDAAPQVIRGEPDCIFIVVGDGPERERLQNMSRELGTQNLVRFIGKIPHKNVVDFMEIADIFVSLSKISNVGNSLLEAMACGKCIVTLNNGGTKEVIINNRTGILIEEDSIDKLPKIIIEILRDKEHRKQLGEGASEFAKKNFQTWEERIDMEVSFIEDFVEKRKR